MTANADNIWQVPAYLPYLQPPLTDESLAEAEENIGYSLPEELLNGRSMKTEELTKLPCNSLTNQATAQTLHRVLHMGQSRL